MKIRMVNILSIFIVLVSPQVNSSPFFGFGDINWWCNQTPFPQQCKYHMSHDIPFSRNFISFVSRMEFLTMTQQTALREVDSALRFTSSLGSRVINDAERSAWRTCLFFYNQSVSRLEQSLDATLKSTADDVQTWLSAAATNIRTCNNGFSDVKMTNNIYPLVISNNATQLISNCLAVNFAFTQENEDIKHEALFTNISRNDAWLKYRVNCVVAQDGSGNFRTITEALASDSGRRTRWNSQFVIYVKQGIYSEIVDVQHNDVVLVGINGRDKTVITGNRRMDNGMTLYDCATFKVSGDGFKAIGITFQNTAGVAAGQALAMASTADRSVFYFCAFKGYQDTLLAQSNRQFYKQCQIYGTVDFIFGNAAAVFQDCTLYVRKPEPGGGLVVTAQDRSSPHENTGFTMHRCKVIAAPELAPFSQYYKVFLGRPWADYSRTVYLRSRLDNFVDPSGWATWYGAPSWRYAALDYREFQNYGAGASTNRRVQWRGYHVIYDIRIAQFFDVTSLINGELWLPSTGVPFDAGV